MASCCGTYIKLIFLNFDTKTKSIWNTNLCIIHKNKQHFPFTNQQFGKWGQTYQI
jgi:hypothetical protein